MSKVRRSMLFLPGANAAMLSTAFVYRPDSVMFDLEDAVAVSEKDSARLLVAQTLKMGVYKRYGIETVVRVNAIDTPFFKDDVEAVVRAGVDVVRLPMTHTPENVQELEKLIESIEQTGVRPVGSTKIIAAIESAQGVVNAQAIAQSSPRMVGIALAAFDYLVDMRSARGDGTELFYARCMVLHAARVAKIQAYDVVFGDVNNDEGFIQEATKSKQLGFDGKSLINPRQIELLNKVYAPTAKEITNAKAVIQAAEEAEQQGLGVVSLNGKMIDAPIITQARMVLEMASQYNLLH